MMAAVTRRRSSTPTSLQRRNSAREVAEKYAGPGKSFKAKCLGSDNVSTARGDAVAADCMKRIRAAGEEVGGYRPKTTITLQLKGVAVFDEKSKLVILQMPVEKVTYVCHDPEDTSVFALIVRTEDSTTGLKLYAFKADQKTAISFVHSAHELFQLMYKLMKAKKRLSEELEESPLPQQENQPRVPVIAEEPGGAQTAPPTIIPQISTDTIETEEHIYAVPSDLPSIAGFSPEEKKRAAMAEWKALDAELQEIAKELGIETETTGTTRTPDTQATAETAAHFLPPPPDANISISSDPFNDEFFQMSFDSPSKFGFTNFDNATSATTDVSASTQPFTSTPENQPQASTAFQHNSSRDDISLALNPFQSSHGMLDPFSDSGQNQWSANFEPNFSNSISTSLAFTNSLYQSQGSSALSSQPSQQLSMGGDPFLSTSSFSFMSPQVIGGGVPQMALTGHSSSSSLVASNPFEFDFDSPFPFGMPANVSTSDPFQNTSGFAPPLTRKSTIDASGSSADPFADLLPLAIPDLLEKQASPSPSPPPPPPPAAEPKATSPSLDEMKASWTTFDGQKEIQSQEGEQWAPTELPKNIAFETDETFGDGIQKLAESHKLSATGGFEDSFQELEVAREQKLPNRFDDNIGNGYAADKMGQADVFADFDNVAGKEGSVASQAQKDNLSGPGFGDYFDFVQQPADCSFGDDFVPTAQTTSTSTQKSWVAFSP